MVAPQFGPTAEIVNNSSSAARRQPFGAALEVVNLIVFRTPTGQYGLVRKVLRDGIKLVRDPPLVGDASLIRRRKGRFKSRART